MNLIPLGDLIKVESKKGIAKISLAGLEEILKSSLNYSNFDIDSINKEYI